MAKKRVHHLKDSHVTVEVQFSGHPDKSKAIISGGGSITLNFVTGVPLATVTVIDVVCPHCAHMKTALEEAEKEIERLTSDQKIIDIK